ncbi:MAG: DUF72 domain-containing protein [Acidobacteria bacterium]|nr:DUF72 domain-containing protein [Acidobacteriota bacterium]
MFCVSEQHSESCLPAASNPESTQIAASPGPPSANLFVGTSGWAYPTWKPGFYAAGVPARSFLHFYARQLTSVEVNYTFRALPKPAQLQSWTDATPPDFRFSFKAPQRITHFQRLRNSHASLSEFIASLAPALVAKKLGPLLFQLPPNFAADTALLSSFLDDPILATHPHLQLAFEFRHHGWFTATTYAVLRRRNAALCVAESADFITPDVATADFRFYRLRRSGGYTTAEIHAFAQRFAPHTQHSPHYIYFKHEDQPTGALNAAALLAATAASNSEARA